jgi:hypothetical protein
MVSVPLTDTINVLPTDTTNAFYSSVLCVLLTSAYSVISTMKEDSSMNLILIQGEQSLLICTMKCQLTM